MEGPVVGVCAGVGVIRGGGPVVLPASLGGVS